MHRTRWLLTGCLALAACQPTPAALPAQPSPPVVTAAASAAAPAATATRTLASPDAAPTRAAPTATLAPTQAVRPSLTPPAGLVYTPMTSDEGAVMAYDPALWKPFISNETITGLAHLSIEGCAIRPPEGRGLPEPDQIIHRVLGRLHWKLYQWGDGATPLAWLDRPGTVLLWLDGYDNPDCAADQEAVLATLLLNLEVKQTGYFDAAGMVFGMIPLNTPTAAPTPSGFTCPNTPPLRLSIGSSAYITAGSGVWLREDPDSESEANQIELFYANSPISSLRITEGPVCGGRYVYWKVAMFRGSDEIVGWMAEGSPEQYFLSPE